MHGTIGVRGCTSEDKNHVSCKTNKKLIESLCGTEVSNLNSPGVFIKVRRCTQSGRG